jgi:hypothetical protein
MKIAQIYLDFCTNIVLSMQILQLDLFFISMSNFGFSKLDKKKALGCFVEFFV